MKTIGRLVEHKQGDCIVTGDDVKDLVYIERRSTWEMRKRRGRRINKHLCLYPILLTLNLQ